MKELPGLSYRDIERMEVKRVGIFFTLLQEGNRMEKEAADKIGKK